MFRLTLFLPYININVIKQLYQIFCSILFNFILIITNDLSIPMISRKNRSLAQLQTSIMRELSHFKTINVGYSLKSTTNLRKSDSLDLKKKPNQIKKINQIQSNTISNSKSIRQIQNYDKIKQINRLFKNTKQGKPSRGKKKIQKKVLNFAKFKLYDQQASLGSTKCIQSRTEQCQKCLKFLKINNEQKQVISKQKTLITQLQNILDEING